MVVVFSLIYVAIQVKQSSALARATTQRDLHQTYQSYLSKVSEDADLIRQGLHDFASLGKSEAITFNARIAPFINHLDQKIRMYESGFETEDNVDLYGDVFMALVCTPGGWAWWEMTSQSFVIEGRKYIQERFANPETLPAPIHETAPFFGPDDPE